MSIKQQKEAVHLFSCCTTSCYRANHSHIFCSKCDHKSKVRVEGTDDESREMERHQERLHLSKRQRDGLKATERQRGPHNNLCSRERLSVTASAGSGRKGGQVLIGRKVWRGENYKRQMIIFLTFGTNQQIHLLMYVIKCLLFQNKKMIGTKVLVGMT